MATYQVPTPDPMNCNGEVTTNWAVFKEAWEDYSEAAELSEKSEAIQAATLRTMMGQDCKNILKRLVEGDDLKKTSKIMEALNAHFVPKRNVVYERYIFNMAIQQTSETSDQFVIRLKKLAETCEYGAMVDDLVRDRLIIGCRDVEARARLFREKKVDLQKATEMLKVSEITQTQLQKMGSDSQAEVVNAVGAKKKWSSSNSSKQPNSNYTNKQYNPTDRQCKYCGRKHSRQKEACPAWGKTCNICGKENHFATVCQSERKSTSSKHSKTVNQLCTDTNDMGFDSDESVYTITSHHQKQFFTNVRVTSPEGTQQDVRFQLDTGASCSTMMMSDYNKLSQQLLPPSHTRLKLYNQQDMFPAGAISLYCEAKNNKKKIHFEVVDKAPVSLLSGRAAEALGLLQIDRECLVNSINATSERMTEEELTAVYSDVFGGLGRLPGELHIDVDVDIKPVQNTRRRVPVPVLDELRVKIEDLVANNIISKVEQPTPWISNIVCVKKPGKLRICIDPQNLNKAICRNHYPIPTIEEVAPRLSKARIFSVVDAKDGFLQVVLDEPSSYLTTFWTPFGRYRWLRMPFGISSAPEEFQRRLEQCLEGLHNVEVIADDIIIFGTGDNEQEAETSHDCALRALLQRCRDRGLRLNKKKLRFKTKSVAYMGHILSSEGLSPDPQKVKAVQQMPRPTDVQGIQRLIGVVTYLAKFVPQLSTVCEPLRRLTFKDVQFDWMEQQEKAFQEIKRLLTAAPVLRYYDLNKEVVIEADSSEVGLGAVLTQEGHPVAYASRALTPTEQRYAQIEKEMLAIVFATERFDQYILGKERILVQTDHKPLVTIAKKPFHSCPKRLQHMRLKLQRYALQMEYKPGPTMHISDTLSRAALEADKPVDKMPEYAIFQLMQETKSLQELEQTENDDVVFVTDGRLNQIRLETIKDSSLQSLIATTATGWPTDKNDVPIAVREYWSYRDEITTQNGLAFRGTRIIIPVAMRPELVKRAHAAHLGVQYTTNTARDIMYWPGMHKDLVEAVQRCATCQEVQPEQQKEPLMTYPVPVSPWQVVCGDCFEVGKQKFALYVDTYSDYIEVFPLKGNSSEELIRKSKMVFATHGTPIVLLTDNGTNYSSMEFNHFATEWEFQHVTSSPHYSRGNGKAESAVKIAKGIINKAQRQHQDVWKALLEWRNAATPGMNSSPAQRLMSRRTRSFLPCQQATYQPRVEAAVPAQVINRRKKAKMYHDINAKSLPDLAIGQFVRAKTHPSERHSTWQPALVTAKVAPRSYTVSANDRTYRRNRSHLRSAKESHTQTPAVKSVLGETTFTPAVQHRPEAASPVAEAVASSPSTEPAATVKNNPTVSVSPQPVVATVSVSPQPVVATRSGRISSRPARYCE